jgi:hypothetical protein
MLSFREAGSTGAACDHWFSPCDDQLNTPPSRAAGRSGTTLCGPNMVIASILTSESHNIAAQAFPFRNITVAD